MKLLRLALFLSVASLCPVWAQDEQAKQPPEEIPDFSNLDEYIYQPKNTATFGFRYISGVKTSFSGNGTINAPEAATDAITRNIGRIYHDGSVLADARTQTVDNGDGTTSTAPIVPDGKTNSWSYNNSAQLTSDGYIRFNNYSAQTLDSGFHNKTAKGNAGMELTMARDMGNIGKHLSWKIFGGFSVNDIQSSTRSAVKANVTTVTDTYDLFGQTPPAAPYSAPTSTTQTVVDSSGNTVLNSSGTAVTSTVDTSTLIGNVPLSRSTTSAIDTVTVVNGWKLHGAYATFRVGPTLVYNINDHLHFSVSVGPALIYAGSTYTVDEVLSPADGNQIIDTLNTTTSKLLVGYYGDATLQYDITERTGLYIGAFYQNAGSYTQTDDKTVDSNGNITTGLGTYTTHVDFNGQQGFRTGLSFKF